MTISGAVRTPGNKQQGHGDCETAAEEVRAGRGPAENPDWPPRTDRPASRGGRWGFSNRDVNPGKHIRKMQRNLQNEGG